MDQRRYPRIQLPLLVELKHPTLGTQRCIARDISEGGVFVHTQNPQIGDLVKPGAKVRLTVQNTLSVEAQPTPTVEMEVRRVEESGLGLAFINVTGRHLWESVDRLRTELAIGEDYFQVHLNALVVNPANAVLVAQQHGKWAFPATFLRVGQDWRNALREFLKRELGIDVSGFGAILAMNSLGHPELPEGAVLDLFVEARTPAQGGKLAEHSRYRTLRWIDRRRDVEEATFASEQIRELADAALLRLTEEDGPS